MDDISTSKLLPLRVLLSFSDPEYEQGFIEHYTGFYRRYAQVSLVLGMILVFGDFIVDYFVYPGVRANFFRVSVCLPVLLGGLIYSFLPQARRTWQSAMSAFIVFVGLILFWILSAMDDQGGAGLKTWVGVLNFTFLEFYCFVILGVQFRYALASGIAILIAFESAIWYAFGTDRSEVAYWTYHVVTVFTLSTAIGWWREYLLRVEYSARVSLDGARKLAEHLAKTKGDFLANMSHEIRTPMNGVLGMTELLLNTDLSERQRRLAETAHQSGIALLQIINDVLDFSKIEAGKIKLEHIDFDLFLAMDEVTGPLAGSAQAKGVELVLRLQEPLPPVVRGDCWRLRQILTNLIANAIKFTNRGEVVVSAALVHDSGSRVVLRFEVIDTGIGIEPDVQAQIFEAFSQADTSTTRKYGGTGLGLAICRHLIGLLDGEIGVRSQPGHGSTFWITVPFDKQSEVENRAPDSIRALRNWRVLVVDDNATNRDVLCDQLAAMGLRADSAAGAQEALAALYAASGRDPYRIALVDMQMPETDGLALAGNIRRDAELGRLEIFMLSSINFDVPAHTLRDLRVRRWLAKPVSRSQLSQCLADLAQEKDTGSAAAEIALRATPGSRSLRVLVAEDNPVNQAVAAAMLESMGFACDLAANGREALDAIARQSYDVVLMDCQMPEMDGFQATRALRTSETASGAPRLPVIALTAHAFEGDREQCLAAGMDAYLAKPYSQTQLEAAIRGRTIRRWEEPAPPEEFKMDEDLEGLDRKALATVRALDKSGGDAVLRRVIELYMKNSPRLVQAMRAATDAGDVAALGNAAHTLKTSSYYVGATRIGALCREIETGAKSTPALVAAAAVTALETEYRRVEQLLTSELVRELG